MKVVNVLGTEYIVSIKNKVEDIILEDVNGYCDTSVKHIVVDDLKDHPNSLKDLEEYKKKVVRHELIHAFLFESGLDSESWGRNEEIVDWIANQFPKMMKAFDEVNAL